MTRARTNHKKTSNLLNDYHLLCYDRTDSTNEEAKRLAEAGASHGAVIWAKQQTAGRGRMGRQWVSQEGNLFASILLTPECPLKEAAQVSFVAAVAALDAIEPLLPNGGELRCKWPNDLLWQGRKLGGILLESFTAGPEDKLWVVVGLGVNVDSFPADTSILATSLKETGVEIISAKIVLSRFIHHFVARYDQWKKRGFIGIRRAWLKQAWGKGERIRVSLPGEEIEGVFKGIDEEGALILGLPGNKKRLIHAGDVFPADSSAKRDRPQKV